MQFRYRVFLLWFILITKGFALKCFNCENKVNPACGAYFKPYQFKVDPCPGEGAKCALQRQTVSDGWVGIVRICYQPGSLDGLNDTNGCRYWTNNQLGYTAYYCFCDTDYCNTASVWSGAYTLITMIAITVFLIKQL